MLHWPEGDRIRRVPENIGSVNPARGSDPLESARNYRRINAVIKDGKVVDRGSLPTAPIISARTPAQ